MTSRERLESLLDDRPIDRVPVYLQIPFALSESGMKPGAFHGYADLDDWRERDPLYCELVSRMERECDNPFIWRPDCMQNLQFFASVSDTRSEPGISIEERVRFTTEVDCGTELLKEIREVKPGTGHSWQIEHLCKSSADARLLLERDWEGAPVEASDFSSLQALLGERGVMWVTIPSPIMVVCRLFDPMNFLLLTRTERALIDELMKVAAERIASNLRSLLELGVGPVIRFGGAEHATPPLMSPEDFDWLVVGYDKPLVDLCKSYGRSVGYHCHGNLRHALGRFREMGVDQLDPTETLPDGDLTLGEARDIAGSRFIFAGNVQCRELFSESVDVKTIRLRVRSMIERAGPGGIIVTTTGTPLEPISQLTALKYHAMIDEVLSDH